MVLQFGAQVSYDDTKKSFQILLSLYNKMQFYSLNYFILAVSAIGSSYIGLTSVCITPNKNPFADFVNNGLIYLQVSSPFYKTQQNSIICIPMLKSIQSQVTDQLSYFNITQVTYLTNSSKVRVSIYNNYSFLVQQCLTLIFYHQTAAIADTFLAYTYSNFQLTLSSAKTSSNLNAAATNNFNIPYKYGAVLQPKCFIGFQDYLLTGNIRQTLKFSLSQAGVTETFSSSQYQISYAYFCIAKIACQSDKLQYYPVISDCQLPCNISNCLVCSSSTSCSLCQPNYFINTLVRCSLCSTNCLNCSSNDKCLTCVDGYFLNNSACYVCPQFCTKCTPSSCISCQNGYFSIGSGCVSCKSVMPNCLSCLGPYICNICADIYYYEGKQKGCALCNTTIPNCYKCNLPNNCLTCYPGFYLFGINKCSNCSHNIDACCNGYVANCSKCKSQTACLICNSAFYINSNFTCSPCIIYGINCISCNLTSCIQCLTGNVLQNNSCVPCSSLLPNCQTCSNLTSCTFCKGSFLLVSNQCFNCPIWPLNNMYYLDEQNKCHTCSSITPNCKNCNQSTTCLKCLPLYYLNNNSCNLCSDSISHCLQCENDIICKLCSSKFYLSPKSTQCLQCQLIIPNCGQCISQTNKITSSVQIKCQICYPQYYPNGVGCSPCILAIPFCLQCSSQAYCTLCSANYFLSPSNICVDCPNILVGCSVCRTKYDCSICLSQYYLQNQQCKHCSTAITNCAECRRSDNSSIICSKCGGVYYLDAFKNCSKCEERFTFCQSCTFNQCISCISGYYYHSQGTVCISCSKSIPNCAYCQSSSNCLICAKDFWLNNGSNSCDSCYNLSRGCQKCQRLPTKQVNCTQCMSGYALYASLNFILSCIECKVSITNCLSCSTPSVCQTCSNSSYLNQFGTCSLCSLYISNCVVCSNSSQCTQCNQSYILMPNGTCFLCNTKQFGVDKSNNPLCLSCNYINSAVCGLCTRSYYLNAQQNQCLPCSNPIKNCASCASASTCIACLPGYFLASSNQYCYSCQISNCDVCSNGKCDKCLSGNFINPSTNNCDSCNTKFIGCNSCSSTICEACTDGYYLQQGICQACSATIPNCILCSNNITCSLKMTPKLTTPQNPFIKPIAMVTIILSIFFIVLFIIWCRKQNKEQFILHQQVPKPQTDRRLTQDEVYANEIQLQKGKICQHCLTNPSQVMRLQLLCSKCELILKRGHKHKIRKDIEPRQNKLARSQDRLANQIALQLQSNIQKQDKSQSKKKGQSKRQISQFQHFASKKANTKSTQVNSNSLRNMF